jgi:hypothetical protein
LEAEAVPHQEPRSLVSLRWMLDEPSQGRADHNASTDRRR